MALELDSLDSFRCLTIMTLLWMCLRQAIPTLIPLHELKQTVIGFRIISWVLDSRPHWKPLSQFYPTSPRDREHRPDKGFKCTLDKYHFSSSTV